MKRFPFMLLIAILAPGANAATNDAVSSRALAQTQRDIATAVAELNTTRDTIAAQSMPLAARMKTLEHAVRDLRAEADQRRAVQRQGDLERQAREDRVHARESDANFMYTALQEYRRALETRVGPASAGALAAGLADADRNLTIANDYAALPQAAATLLDLSDLWNLARLGGEVFPGECLDDGGRAHAGRFLVLGPVTYFVADSNGMAGIVGRRVGSLNPSLLASLNKEEASAAKTVADGGEAFLPVDVSGGDALRVTESHESLWAHITSGGWFMLPLAGVGLLGLVLSASRFIALGRIHPPALEALTPIIEKLARQDVAGAQAAATAIGGPVGELLREGIAHHTASTETLEELMHERMLGIVPTLDRHLGMLAVLGSSAPLLGLLGTVTGIMHTFRLITIFGSGDARLLSSGISEALVATQTGLFIAIPILLIHAFLARRVRTILTGLEQVIVAFVNRVKPPEDELPE